MGRERPEGVSRVVLVVGATMGSTYERMHFVLAPRLGQIVVAHGAGPYEDIRRAADRVMLEVEHQFFPSEEERNATRQVLARFLFNEACLLRCPREQVAGLIRAREQLGLPNIESEYELAVNYAQWASNVADSRTDARIRIEATEVRVAALPGEHQRKSKMLQGLSAARALLEVIDRSPK
jgi:hypothetical protein